LRQVRVIFPLTIFPDCYNQLDDYFKAQVQDRLARSTMPPAPRSGGSKYWCFTYNNPANNNTPIEEVLNEHIDRISYYVYQLELSESGTPHLQGYVEFKTRTRMSQVLSMLQCHWEHRRESAEKSARYCKKTESRVEGPWEWGTISNPNPGKRTDLMMVKDAIDAGRNDKSIADEFFGSWVRNRQSFAAYRLLATPIRDFKSQVIVLVGASRIGKSYWAMKNTRGMEGTGFNCSDGSWFDGYNGADDIVMDDFNGWIPFHKLLRLLDRYQQGVQFKGGFINWAPRRIVITSNKPWWEWYDWTKVNGDKTALEMRMDHYFSFPDMRAGCQGIAPTDLLDGISDPYPPPPPPPEPVAPLNPNLPIIDLTDLEVDAEAEFPAVTPPDSPSYARHRLPADSPPEGLDNMSKTRFDAVMAGLQFERPTSESETTDEADAAEVDHHLAIYRRNKRKNPFIDDEAGH